MRFINYWSYITNSQLQILGNRWFTDDEAAFFFENWDANLVPFYVMNVVISQWCTVNVWTSNLPAGKFF